MDTRQPPPIPDAIDQGVQRLVGSVAGNVTLEYRRALSWLYERQDLGIDLGLRRVESLLQALGDPQLSFRTVHVAGTNGKGSVAAFVAAALHAGDHSTGLYTSPHLVEFTERISVDGHQISRLKLTDLIERVRPHAEALDRAGDPPTFFELTTVVAFLHFREVGVSWAVVEAGMGGRHDATNVIRPAVSVITNVSRDHADFLGADIRSIAEAKAGVIKPGVPVVTGAEGVALDPIKEHSERLQAPLRVVPKGSRSPSGDASRRPVQINPIEYGLAAVGDHQRHNAALAIAVCEELRKAGVEMSPLAIRDALSATALPGRMQSIEVDGVELLIDAAHNLAGAEALGAHIEERYPSYDLIVGFNRDKDWPAMIELWLPRAQRVWAVPVRSRRSEDPGAIADHIEDRVRVEERPSFAEAFAAARASGTQHIVVAGSIFLAGEAVAVLTGRSLREVGGLQ